MSESSPETTVGNVEGDVNVEQPESPESEESAPSEVKESPEADTTGDEAQQDTGALQE